MINMIMRTLYYYYQLRRDLSLSLSKLQEIQRKKLLAIVKHAYENVPFYHRKFDEAGIKPNDIRSVDDLRKIPTVTKSEIQSSSLTNVLARGVEVEKCSVVRTSGSTGKPLTLYLDKNAADFRFALLSRTYWEDGLRPWDRMAIISFPRELRKSKDLTQYRGLARRKHISVLDDVDSQLTVLQDYQPDVIQSYPSSLTILAHACKEKGIRIRPRFILTGSELLHSGDADLIRSTFECDSIDDYGCHEIGPLAWECREHLGYHINIDGVVMEFVDDGEQVAPGERGQIVCTSLVNHSMPFIRYLVEDQGVCMNEQCSCGRPLPIMKMLEGRKDDFLTALNGRIISPRIFGPLWPLGNLGMTKQFRVIQERRDKLTIQLAGTESPLSNESQEDVRKEIRKILGDGMEVEFQLVENIERDAGGKLRRTISYVPVDWHSRISS